MYELINCIQCGKRGDFGGGAMAYIAEWVWSGGVPIPWGWKGGWGDGAVLDLVYAPELFGNCKVSVKPYLSGVVVVVHLCRIIIPWATE